MEKQKNRWMEKGIRKDKRAKKTLKNFFKSLYYTIIKAIETEFNLPTSRSPVWGRS